MAQTTAADEKAMREASSTSTDSTYDELAMIDAESGSDPICSSAGCTQFKHKKAKLGYPIDYPVPSFGADPEISANANSLSIAEAMHKHKLIMGTPESKAKWHNVAKDTLYDFAPDLDGDIVSTQSHLDGAEKVVGHKWVINDLQSEADIHLDSDPICSSAGCTQFKHKKAKLGYPIDYPVPNLGEDPEITAAHNALSIAEAMHQHKLIMGTPESKAKWHNVAKDTEYNFAPDLDSDVVSTQDHLTGAEKTVGHKWVINDLQSEAEINLGSDPICSSAGCTQYKHKKAKLGYPIDYPVPNLGEDPEITAAHNALSIAEAMHKHKLIMGTPESKAKWHNVAKDTLYNFDPELDGDMKTTATSLSGAELITNHKWTIA